MKTLIADKFAEAGISRLKELGFEVKVDPGLEGTRLAAEIRNSNSEILIVRSTRVARETIEAGEDLKLIIRAGSGYDTIDVEAATDRGVRVCNCPGTNAVAVAELTIGLMIALDRRIVDETDDLRHRIWNKKEYSKARGLKGRTVGIVGLGRIGYEVARRARAFDMKLLYTDLVRKEELETELNLETMPLADILAESDFVTLHVPGGELNHHMIGHAELSRMKKTAFLLNCSRGGLVDEEAQAEAVKQGQIAGAALDVYEIEPAAGDHEFKDSILEEPHVYGTHHVGASTEQAQTAVAEEAVKIIQTYRDKGEFLNCVNRPYKGAF